MAPITETSVYYEIYCERQQAYMLEQNYTDAVKTDKFSETWKVSILEAYISLQSSLNASRIQPYKHK